VRMLAALTLLLALPAGAAEPPRRIVSLNLCTDQFLVLLAPDRATALSPLGRDPALSVVARQAAAMPWVRPDAEAVLSLHADLVLAGPFGARTTLAALEHRGIRVERTVMPQDFPAIRAETRRFAALLGAPAKGEALLAEMDRTLAAIPPRPPIRALALQARGYTAYPGSLEDSVLHAAGLTDIGAGRRLGLEAIAADPPALLVTADPPDYPSLATDLLRHPILDRIPRRTWPPALLACGGPWTATAVARLAP